MELHFLGTSSGTPTKDRNVSALGVVQTDGKAWCLVDCGEATQHQLLHSRLSLHKLSAIFITHIHGDHCYGLPGLLASAGMSGRTQPLSIVAPKGIAEWVQATVKHTELFLPYEIRFEATETLDVLNVGNFTVQAKALSHRVPSFAYSFSETETHASLDFDQLAAHDIPRGPLWGQIMQESEIFHNGQRYQSDLFLIKVEHTRKAVICGDNDTPEILSDFIEGCHVLVHEATYNSDFDNWAKEVGHSCAKWVAQFAQTSALPCLILTHFRPRYLSYSGPQRKNKRNESIEQIRVEAESAFDGDVYLARDFDIYSIERDGAVVLQVSKHGS